MNGLDVLIGIFILIGAYRGYKAGFIVEVTSLVAIILGIFVGFHLLDAAIILLKDHIDVKESILPFLAFAIVFLIVVIGVSLLGRIFKGIVENTFFGSFDQAFGAVFGILKIMFLTSIVIWLLNFVSIIPSAWMEESILYPMVAGIAPELAGWLSAMFPSLENLF